MLVNGKRIRHMGRVYCIMQMEISMKVNGITIRPMDLECINIQIMLAMKGTGLMIDSKVSE